MSFLIRLIQVVLMTAAVAGSLLLAVMVLNRLLRVILDQFGVEIFDTASWLKAKFKRRKAKRNVSKRKDSGSV